MCSHFVFYDKYRLEKIKKKVLILFCLGLGGQGEECVPVHSKLHYCNDEVWKRRMYLASEIPFLSLFYHILSCFLAIFMLNAYLASKNYFQVYITDMASKSMK